MRLKTKIISATPMITVIVYLLLGFCADAWHPGWIVFFAIPLVPVLLGTKSLYGIYPLLTILAYLLMGFIWDLWHPGWIIFLTIPVVEIFLPKRHVKVIKGRRTVIFDADEDLDDDED